ncbi:YncE family protein [Rufibacter roseus]|uniref:YncE family protein n=1 Tax=Rufibacter roseus TaxID=1567108 RepID=UPI003670E1A5
MKKFLALSVSLISFSALAQKEATTWYFGRNAGLSFSQSTEPTPIKNGRLFSEEGSAVVSDASGNLLFYSNGMQVWNKNHQLMANGTELKGHESATQSSLILLKPGSSTIYYLFTTDFQGQDHGLQYHLIDMSKNGGLGEVISKNNLVFAPVTEKLTAVRHRNGRDFWIVTHRWNSTLFYAYLLSPSGITFSPVESNVGSMHTGDNGGTIGYLKASVAGNKLAMATWAPVNKLELFDFNNATGQVTNAVDLGQFEEAYGVEFSPDGSKLYGSRNGKNGREARIFQFDLSSGSPETIVASGQVVAKSMSSKFGALQLAPDGRIYVARNGSSYLGVIRSPNELGNLSNYKDNGISLGTQRSEFGLPNFPSFYFQNLTAPTGFVVHQK